MGAATALKAEEGTEIPGEELGTGTETQTGERDFDAEAREHGWVSKEEFLAKPNADPNRWVDAETFMKRADEMLPLIKADRARLKRELDSLKKDLKRATAHFEGAEKRAYERAKSEIEGRIEAAVESGDVAGAKEAVKDLEKLKPDENSGAKYTQSDLLEAFDAFREEHSWYDKGNLANATELEINARLAADRIIERRLRELKPGSEPPPAEFIDGVVDAVFEKYPALKGKPARQKPASDVAGGLGSRGGSGKSRTWDNLPDDAKRQFQRFIDRGIGVKDTGDRDKDASAARAYYAKTFDWEGYKS